QVNSRSIDQKSGEIWTAQADLQPISFKSDRLLVQVLVCLDNKACGFHAGAIFCMARNAL
ncbi:MAG: hypothetical protein NUV63_08620, partial [Gallionella sp.]|nr:hypothetical protein [Gallionella sp.]